MCKYSLMAVGEGFLGDALYSLKLQECSVHVPASYPAHAPTYTHSLLMLPSVSYPSTILLGCQLKSLLSYWLQEHPISHKKRICIL